MSEVVKSYPPLLQATTTASGPHTSFHPTNASGPHHCLRFPELPPATTTASGPHYFLPTTASGSHTSSEPHLCLKPTPCLRPTPLPQVSITVSGLHHCQKAHHYLNLPSLPQAPNSGYEHSLVVWQNFGINLSVDIHKTKTQKRILPGHVTWDVAT